MKKGSRHSPETLQKLKNVRFSKEHRMNLSLAKQGTHRSMETKDRISKSMQQMFASGYKNPMQDKHISETAKSKLRETWNEKMRSGYIHHSKDKTPWNKGLTKEIDNRVLKYATKNRYKIRTPEMKEHLRLINTGKKASEIAKNNMRIAGKINWLKYPERARKMFNAIKRKPTKPEKWLLDYIQTNKLPYEYVGNNKFRIGNINPDFVNISGKNEVIELNGCFWHRCEKCFPKLNNKCLNVTKLTATRDKYKQEIYKKYGFHVITIWEHELKDGSFINKLNQGK